MSIEINREVLYEPVQTDYYQKIWNVRKAGITYPYTQWQVDEIEKCKEPKTGIHYYFKTYLKTLDLDSSQLVPFEPRSYETTMIDNLINNRFNIFKNPRQSGKTTTVSGVFTYWMNFFPYEICGIVANKEIRAFDVIEVMETMFQNLPFWMQQGVMRWQAGGFELENGSKVAAEATSRDALRGLPIKHLYWDEVAAVRSNLAGDFLASVYPTISSAKQSTITMASTPDGYNHFAKFWYDAKNGKNQFIPFEVKWNEVPGRDEKYKKETISNIGEMRWNAEYECIFLGSADTLISGKKLQDMFHENPIKTYYEEKLKIYENPILTKRDPYTKKIIEDGHYYAVVCDVSEGKKQDYYTFSVIDCTSIPYKQVATYRDNDIPYQLFATIVDEVVKMYGSENTLLIIETNHGFGTAVLDIIAYDLGTDCVIYSEDNKNYGLKMTTKSKRIGCSNLKSIVEFDKLIIKDFDTINELYKFSRKKNVYEAEEGHNDDMVMNLVFFSYVASTDYLGKFVDSPSTYRAALFKAQQEKLQAEIPAFGVVSDGTEKYELEDDGDDEKLLTLV
jgi:hypothetical protein